MWGSVHYGPRLFLGGEEGFLEVKGKLSCWTGYYQSGSMSAFQMPESAPCKALSNPPAFSRLDIYGQFTTNVWRHNDRLLLLKTIMSTEPLTAQSLVQRTLPLHHNGQATHFSRGPCGSESLSALRSSTGSDKWELPAWRSMQE